MGSGDPMGPGDAMGPATPKSCRHGFRRPHGFRRSHGPRPSRGLRRPHERCGDPMGSADPMDSGDPKSRGDPVGDSSARTPPSAHRPKSTRERQTPNGPVDPRVSVSVSLALAASPPELQERRPGNAHSGPLPMPAGPTFVQLQGLAPRLANSGLWGVEELLRNRPESPGGGARLISCGAGSTLERQGAEQQTRDGGSRGRESEKSPLEEGSSEKQRQGGGNSSTSGAAT